MQTKSQKRKRVPFRSIQFSDTRNGVKGFATDWYFWVSDAFKPALDIGFNEYMDDGKTALLRNKRANERFGVSHEELKRRIKASGENLLDSDDHNWIMSYASRYLLETQGEPPMYSFRETDGLESKSGEWYVQVEQAVADTEERQGNVGFRLYGRNRNPKSGEGIWIATSWQTASQRDFVDLLRTGRCSVVDLANPQATTAVVEGPVSIEPTSPLDADAGSLVERE
jgi:hypothetical protein